ncbi:hypothetical protein DEU42_11270 [Flavobacterium sp. AG291]|nr:hypothetical protein DEU42_11270 [Flavobacterium sp. AG291]
MVLKKPLRLKNKLRKTKTNYNLYRYSIQNPDKNLIGVFCFIKSNKLYTSLVPMELNSFVS